MNRGLLIAGVLLAIGAFISRRAYANIPLGWQYGNLPNENFYPSDHDYIAEESIDSPYGGIDMVTGLTRGERNNNPGNIVKSNNPWLGKIAGNDSRFETFSSPQYGIRALAKLLTNYIGDGHDTIRKIITRYAPALENDTNGYIASVVRQTGISADTVLSADPDILNALVPAIIQHENGRNIYLASGVIEQGIALV